MHYWKLVSTHNFSKYDVKSAQANTGYQSAMFYEVIAREKIYHKKRDKTFDFMIIGENDFERVDDKFT